MLSKCCHVSDVFNIPVKNLRNSIGFNGYSMDIHLNSTHFLDGISFQALSRHRPDLHLGRRLEEMDPELPLFLRYTIWL